jgi:hypothetical protein
MLPDSINIAPYTPTTGLGTLGGAAARSFTSLRSSLTSEFTVHSVGGTMDVSLSDLCNKIKYYHFLRLATIVSASTYVQRRSLIAPHRFVILCLHRNGKENVWIRLDRMPTSRNDLVTGLGVTDANDRVHSLDC